LPPLVLGVGLALSLLLWSETRQALIRAATGGADPFFPGALLLCGVLLSLGLAFITWRLVRAQRLTVRRQVRLERLRERDGRALENKRLEKEVMSRALSDSEQRTRDFIRLGTGIALELDDARAIGYISPQVEAWLGHTPSTLAGDRVSSLLPESEHSRLDDTLDACRREATHQQLETWLQDREGRTHPVQVRVCAVIDALSHCQGFRMVASPREAIE
ncbi:MAG: PAS domain S-box protein, partial [Pseudomonadota bacterium]